MRLRTATLFARPMGRTRQVPGSISHTNAKIYSGPMHVSCVSYRAHIQLVPSFVAQSVFRLVLRAGNVVRTLPFLAFPIHRIGLRFRSCSLCCGSGSTEPQIRIPWPLGLHPHSGTPPGEITCPSQKLRTLSDATKPGAVKLNIWASSRVSTWPQKDAASLDGWDKLLTSKAL